MWNLEKEIENLGREYTFQLKEPVVFKEYDQGLKLKAPTPSKASSGVQLKIQTSNGKNS